MQYLTPKVLADYPICGARIVGGNKPPGERMTPGLRTFYSCGATISCQASEVNDNVLHLLLKNCWCEGNKKVADGNDQ